VIAVLVEHSLYDSCPRHRWHVQNAIRFWRPRHGLACFRLAIKQERVA
jgi:hypothetical protein